MTDEPMRNGAFRVAAVAAGNALEFYDFLVYAYFALPIGRCFFPSHSPSASLLASLATFGAGFLMRPVGAMVIGPIGDRIGRRPAMLLSFGLMGVAVAGLALTPSYAAIGTAAPVLAVGWRLLQGLALGGDVGPSTAFLVETAPAHRRGLYVSLQFTGQYAATFLASAGGLGLSLLMTPVNLDSWGWRLAFLFGAALAPAAWLLRQGLTETRRAQSEPSSNGDRSAPWKPLVLGFVMLAGATSVTYVLNYLATYAATTLHMTGARGLAATGVVGLCGMLFAPLGGWLSDRVGRKPVMLAPAALLLVCALPAFALIVTLKSALGLLCGAALLSACASCGFAVMLCALVEWMPAHRRSGGLGLIYALAISVFGGTTQFTVAWLSAITKSALVPGWYMTGAIAACLCAILLFPETAPIKRLRSPRR